MKFFLISLCIVSAVVSATSDYCQLGCYQYYSGRTEKNIGCLDAASKTAMAKCSATVEVLNEAMKTEIVNAHNERRNRLALGKLPGFKPACQMATMQWSEDLAQLADIYIRSCIDGHDKCHKTKDFEFAGQNLFWISYMPEADNQFVNKFVDAWYSEYKACIQQYTNCYPSGYHPRSQSQMIGHFTVMMNEKNTHVGCSIGRINGETNVVCNYASTNMINNPIYKPCAKPAEKCETGQNPLFPGLCSKRLSDTKLHEIYLDNKEIKLSWMVDWYKQEVLFHLQNAFNEQHRWFYLGFSKRGGIGDADICFFENQNGFFNVVTDTYTSPDGKFVHKDYQQDCVLFKMDEYTLAFKRKFDTCDPSDFRMHEGTMYIMWARGEVDLELTDFQFPFPNVSSQESGIKMMQLLRADKILIPETDLKLMEIKLDKVPVPVKETTYWCHIQKLDNFLQQKHHIIQFEPIITSPGVVHHLEVFHCETDWNVDIPLYSGDCEEMPVEAKVCSKVIALWAMGASTFTYPPETGLPIGGKTYNPYIRLEVHFNNPELEKGHVDSSGLRIKMVSQLRQFDAGVIELGLEYTDKMAIPPGQVAFPLSGYCIAECTELAFPASGIVVFGSQLHTHLRGVRILTRHFRGNEELRELNRDDYYSHHFQEMRNLHYKPRVLPGDALVTTCYYDTIGYDNATLGGFSISDEMCVNYVHYYPATKLELCKSSVSEDTLENYFIYMKKKEHQHGIRLNGARSKNYRNIKWTQPRVDQLYTMYIQEPLSMQCNKSDGFRFDGYEWEGAPITPVQIKIPIHRKLCPNYNPLWLKPLERGECDLLGECIY